jgi:steroid delta-isomerase-like uncharacterized protein
MAESLKKIVYRTFVEEVINKGRVELIPELYSREYVDHSAPPGAPTSGDVFEGIAQIPRMFRGAFPDVHFTIEDMVEEGDWVATRVTGRGQHLGRPFMAIPPTGRRVAWTSHGLFRLKRGKIVEHYGQPDLGGLREQLAARPEPGSLDENRAMVARYVYEVNKQNYDAFDEFVVDDYVDHDPIPGQKTGRAALKQAYRAFSSAFPDIWFTFEDLVAEGDLVVGRGVIEGTHKGAFLGVPPTNKRIRWTGTRMFRVRNGKVIEGWFNFDMLGMMRQLGLGSASGSSGSSSSAAPAGEGTAAAMRARKVAIQRMYDETNRGNIDVLRELLADDFVSYGGAGFQDLHGPEAFIGLYRTFVAAFPDLHFDVQQIVVGDDMAAVRGIQTGTHQGNFLGMVPATGKRVNWTGTAIFRFNGDGKIVERWQDLDNLSLFQQLGVIPAFGSAGG